MNILGNHDGATAEQVPTTTKKRKLGIREQALSRTASPMPQSSLRDEILRDEDEEAEAPFAPDSVIARLPIFVPSAEPGYFTTADVPSGRNYRYIPATRSAAYSPSRIESPECYRTAESPPTNVRVSWEDRSSFVRVTPDGLGLAGEKGYRSARLNVPVREGQWYFEVEMEAVDGHGESSGGTRDGAHVRLGWGRREASLNGPAGLDGYSYAMRDKTGEKVTLSRPRPYGRPFKTGDVVGLYISLPPARKPDPNDPNDPARISTKRLPVPYKGQYYFESSEYLHSKEMMALTDQRPAANMAAAHPGIPSSAPVKQGATVKNAPADRTNGRSKRPGAKTKVIKTPVDVLRPLPILENSSISFFVNGEDQGKAFENVYSYLQLPKLTSDGRRGQTVLKERENPFDDGTLGYYPFISLFGNAKVRINPGPNFKYPPPENFGESEDGQHRWRPLCDRYGEYMAELWAIDDEQERKLRIIREEYEASVALEAEKERKKKEKAERQKKVKEMDAAIPKAEPIGEPLSGDLANVVPKPEPFMDRFLSTHATYPSSLYPPASLYAHPSYAPVSYPTSRNSIPYAYTYDYTDPTSNKIPNHIELQRPAPAPAPAPVSAPPPSSLIVPPSPITPLNYRRPVRLSFNELTSTSPSNSTASSSTTITTGPYSPETSTRVYPNMGGHDHPPSSTMLSQQQYLYGKDDYQIFDGKLTTSSSSPVMMGQTRYDRMSIHNLTTPTTGQEEKGMVEKEEEKFVDLAQWHGLNPSTSPT